MPESMSQSRSESVAESLATVVRMVRPEELGQVGDLTVRAYVEATNLSPDSEYVDKLRRADERAAASPMLVAVRGGELVGAVSLCPLGSRWSEIARPGELELRMLVVEPSQRGTGIADALLAGSIDHALAHGENSLVISVIGDNLAAHRLYAKHGFVRQPDRDWDPTPQAHLLVYTKRL